MVAKDPQHLESIFTADEIKYCQSKARPSEHYAVRFAAKEAFLKALGTGYRDGLAFSEIEICHDERGKPEILLHGKVKDLCCREKIIRSLISLSHTSEIAIAFAILEK